MGSLESVNLVSVLLDYWRKALITERTHAGTGRTCKHRKAWGSNPDLTLSSPKLPNTHCICRCGIQSVAIYSNTAYTSPCNDLVSFS